MRKTKVAEISWWENPDVDDQSIQEIVQMHMARIVTELSELEVRASVFSYAKEDH